MSKVHELKTWPTYWDAVERGEKLFEVRENDRFFQAGDVVELIRLCRDAPANCEQAQLAAEEAGGSKQARDEAGTP